MLAFNDLMSPFCGSTNNSDRLENHEVKIIKASDFFSRTVSPMTTTASVIGIKFQNGVAIAADVGGNYGSLNRYKYLERIYKVNNSIVMATTGDYADFQYIKDFVQQRIISEEILEDNFSMKPFSLHTWLTRVMYNRRSKMDPLWNNVVVAGFDAQGPFLGAVDKLGLSYQDTCVATGMGSYLVTPMLRDAVDKYRGNMTKQQAQQVLAQGMEILFYRDTQSAQKFQTAFVTAEGVEITPEIEIKGAWDIATYVSGY
uniref:Proteasome subunit beta n=1 Tax=Riptortus pedestris TaxID=329032 RepID=R4WT15_RIPPE|nr:proteasome subunit beta type [Riptortus pedestris]